VLSLDDHGLISWFGLKRFSVGEGFWVGKDALGYGEESFISEIWKKKSRFLGYN
jgi:hypothetical protein